MEKASCRAADLVEIYYFREHGSASCVVQNVIMQAVCEPVRGRPTLTAWEVR